MTHVGKTWRVILGWRIGRLDSHGLGVGGYEEERVGSLDKNARYQNASGGAGGYVRVDLKLSVVGR